MITHLVYINIHTSERRKKMKDRIRQIMEMEQLTPTRFADKLQINRAVISHILNGRNNPSLDVVTKILSEMEYINPEWLLNGTGSIYKEGVEAAIVENEPDLFNQSDLNQSNSEDNMDNRREISSKEYRKSNNIVDIEPINHTLEKDKKITQIIIYYSDNTFETFVPPVN